MKEISQAFRILRDIIRAEGGDPDRTRYLIDDIEADLKKILEGRLVANNGEVIFLDELELEY